LTRENHTHTKLNTSLQPIVFNFDSVTDDIFFRKKGLGNHDYTSHTIGDVTFNFANNAAETKANGDFAQPHIFYTGC